MKTLGVDLTIFVRVAVEVKCLGDNFPISMLGVDFKISVRVVVPDETERLS